MNVGLFELEPLVPGRWRVLNTRTYVTHVTYGTEAEVIEALERASAAWERRLGPKRSGGGWREKMKGEAEENIAAKRARDGVTARP